MQYRLITFPNSAQLILTDSEGITTNLEYSEIIFNDFEELLTYLENV